MGRGKRRGGGGRRGMGVGKRISGAEKETATNMVGKKRRGRQVEREVEDR